MGLGVSRPLQSGQVSAGDWVPGKTSSYPAAPEMLEQPLQKQTYLLTGLVQGRAPKLLGWAPRGSGKEAPTQFTDTLPSSPCSAPSPNTHLIRVAATQSTAPPKWASAASPPIPSHLQPLGAGRKDSLLWVQEWGERSGWECHRVVRVSQG